MQGIIAIILVLFLQSIVGETAGVALHSYLISLIHHELPKNIQEAQYIPFLITGAFAPDAFYSCGNAELSEEIHWPDFLRVAVHYYHDISGSSTSTNNNEKNLELKAFLYGIFTHQVSDSTWHSLGLKEGLLSVITQLDFDGDNDAAHRYIDVAGDFILLGDLIGNSKNKFNNDILGFFSDNWQYPDLNMLIEIFNRMGYQDISYYNVFYCLERGRLALRSEIAVLEQFEVLYSSKSPWFFDNWRTYYEGGVEDWQFSTITCLNRLTKWFEEGVTDQKLCGAIFKSKDLDPSVDALSLSNLNRSWTFEYHDDSLFISPLIPQSQFGGNLLIGDFGLGGSKVLAVSATQEDNYKGSVYLLPLADILPVGFYGDNSYQMRYKSLQNTDLESFRHSSRFGDKLEAYSPFEGIFLLLICSSSPQQFIEVFHESLLVLTIKWEDDIPEFGQSGNILQSISLSSIKNNITGYTDLIIGLPMFTYLEKGNSPSDGIYRQRGKVVVLSGERFSYYVLNDLITETSLQSLLSVRSIKIPKELETGKSGSNELGYEHFGSTISVLEQENLVLIGAESLGLISVFEPEITDIDERLDFVFKGIIMYDSTFIEKSQIVTPIKRSSSKQSSLFGSKYILSYQYSQETYIIVNSHATSGTVAKLSGSVTILKVIRHEEDTGGDCVSFELFKTLILHDIPDSSLANLGKSVSIKISSIIVGSSRCVYRILLDELHSTQTTDTKFLLDESYSIRCTLEGKSGYSSAIEAYQTSYEQSYVIIGDDLFGKEQLMKDSSMNIGRINIITV